jgi:complement component 1 Q subcomponent-binding protein, mitochondrial
MAMALASATAAALFRSALSAPHGAGARVRPQRRQPFLAPLHAAKGPGSAPVVLEGKAKGKKKKGPSAGNLPAALDVEIREAQEYLDSDQQVAVTPLCFATC